MSKAKWEQFLTRRTSRQLKAYLKRTAAKSLTATKGEPVSDSTFFHFYNAVITSLTPSGLPASPDGWAVWGVVVSTRWWLLVDHCVLSNWDRLLVRAVKGLISRAGMVSICPLLWQRDIKLQQTNQPSGLPPSLPSPLIPLSPGFAVREIPVSLDPFPQPCWPVAFPCTCSTYPWSNL